MKGGKCNSNTGVVGVGVIVVLVWRGISHIQNILIQRQTASSCMLSVERLERHI